MPKSRAVLGFNRDIVECKDKSKGGTTYNRYDLIETLWNVKMSTIKLFSNAKSGFNRDIVECKV